ncbi:MAG: hypothetical protein WC107_00160 [Patescibacteria group bacterium]
MPMPMAIPPDQKNKGSFLLGNPLLMKCLKWTLIFLIILLTLSLLTKPARGKWSNNYVEKGDLYLEQKKFLSADLEYKKALVLNGKNEKAAERRQLAELGTSDILSLEDFFKEKKLTEQSQYFELAKKVPAEPIQAVKNSKLLIEKEEFQLASAAAKIAIEMDKTSADGWLYLGISQLKIAENIEMNSNLKKQLREEAKQSFTAAKSLNPDDELVRQYLNAIE